MSEPSKAVFLSYASQDADTARRICEALRAAGIEVWFDQSELRGGDVWDHKIRQQILDCSLFIPVISTHTDERSEGYFRLEWKLAVDRSHLMADDAAFLFPVVIDDTSGAIARVPEKFHTVQWTPLPAGRTPPEFCQQVKALLAGTAKPSYTPASALRGAPIPKSLWSSRRMAIAVTAMLLIGAVAVLTWRMLPRPPSPAPAASASPEHSIAVLPFTDMSERKDQEYLSDGLAEELLNLLSKVPGLQIAARTSAFSFKGHADNIPAIGRRLMVANLLEGSVLKVGNHLRVTAQLVRTDNGYQVWSGAYDRELGDVFLVQDEIAVAVVKALKVSLLGTAPPRSVSTQNPDAYLVFLRGRAKMASQRLADTKLAAEDFARVIKLDPSYGPAYVELATAKMRLAEFEVTVDRPAAFDSATEEVKVLIQQALALDPTDPQAYVERGYLRSFSDRKGAEKDYRRGIELNPSSARGYAELASVLYEDPRRRDEALTMIDRARQLDPLEPEYDVLKALDLYLGRGQVREPDALLADVVARHPLYLPALQRIAEVRFAGGHYADAVMYAERALKLDPLNEMTRLVLIDNYLNAGDPGAALQVADVAPHQLPIQRLLLYLHQGDWRRAAEVSYAAWEDGTMMPIAVPAGVSALRMDARTSGDFRRARELLEHLCRVTWSAGGVPTIPMQIGGAYECVALGDILIASGARARGERLLRASLADMNYVAHDLKRGDHWYVHDQAVAAALLGDQKAALATLRRAVDIRRVTSESLEGDPAFNAIRGTADFQEMIRALKAAQARERQALDRLRASGRVPDRSAPANSDRITPRAPPAKP